LAFALDAVNNFVSAETLKVGALLSLHQLHCSVNWYAPECAVKAEITSLDTCGTFNLIVSTRHALQALKLILYKNVGKKLAQISRPFWGTWLTCTALQYLRKGFMTNDSSICEGEAWNS